MSWQMFRTPDNSIQVIAGRRFARNLAKRCPWCQEIFYTYQDQDAPEEPGRVDPDPAPRSMIGQRETCWHHLCQKAEQEHQFRRSQGRA